jgi:photosystem II stability/assembly factor-like uncharacterized protein
VLNTTNGGSTWTAQASPTSTAINGMSCASATTCVAVGDLGLVLGTTNGGATWTQLATTNNGHFLAAVSCPSTSFEHPEAVGGTAEL